MSTDIEADLLESEASSDHNLHDLLCCLQTDASLFEREQLRKRLIALDDIDAAFGELGSEEYSRCADSGARGRTSELRGRLEAANAELYDLVRSEIVRGGRPDALLRCLRDCAGGNELSGVGDAVRFGGLGFDCQDELLSEVLQLSQPREMGLGPSAEMVAYQPTPVRHILDLIAAVGLGGDDTFVDLGSGLGHVPLLVAMVTGARCVGIEVQPEYVAIARECARRLGLRRVEFLAQDVREADLSRGEVFYLYTPFTGSMLSEVLGALRCEAARRAITVCSLGPCTGVVAKEKWLKARAQPDELRVAVFESR